MIPRTKVFVGSLPPGSKPEDLRRLFENYGVVTECDIMNRCGFVHMETQEMAENAIRALNNTTFRGVTISVEPGRMKERGASVGLGRGGPGGRSRSGGSNPRHSDSGDRRGGRSGGGRFSGYGNFGGRDDPDGQGGRPRFGGNRRDEGGRDFDNDDSFRDVPDFGNQGPRDSYRDSGPIRRDHTFGPRSTPYNRNSGGVPGGAMGRNNTFDQWESMPRGGDRYDDSGFCNFNVVSGIGNMGSNDRFGVGYGMGNQDRRGFALPERQSFGDDIDKGRGVPSMGGGVGVFRGGNQGFERRGGGGNFDDDMFSRRGDSVGVGGNFGDSARGISGGGRASFGRINGGGGGFNRNPLSAGGSNYNQSPLGGGGNRNGPPRRDMAPNRRY